MLVGLPHYGHILAGTIKDVVTRYAHQTDHYVSRRFGWDTHGLPVGKGSRSSGSCKRVLLLMFAALMRRVRNR